MTYSKPRTPIRTASKILRSFFEEMEHCGIPTTVYYNDCNSVYNWRMGKHSPNVMTFEEIVNSMGYELIIRKKE